MNTYKKSLWEPYTPIVDWFDGHPLIAALVALVFPGIPQLLMGHVLFGAIMLVLAIMTWPFFYGWVIGIVAALHAYAVTPKDPEPAPTEDSGNDGK